MYQLQRQLSELLERHEDLEQQLEAERQARRDSQVLDSISDRVAQPRQFLQLLESEGVLIERAGEPMVKTSLGLRPLAEGVDELLEGEYSHFFIGKPSPAAPAKPVGRFLQGGDRLNGCRNSPGTARSNPV